MRYKNINFEQKNFVTINKNNPRKKQRNNKVSDNITKMNKKFGKRILKLFIFELDFLFLIENYVHSFFNNAIF